MGIPKGANVTFIDLDAQRVEEVVTGGWTDSQIRAKKITEILAMIDSDTRVLEVLQKNVADQQSRLYDLHQIMKRKQLIGD